MLSSLLISLSRESVQLVFSRFDVVQPSVQFVQRISNAQQLNLLLAVFWVGATHAFEKSGHRKLK
jgi:hypothetical protein